MKRTLNLGLLGLMMLGLNTSCEKEEKPYDPDYTAEADYTVSTFGLNMEMVYVEGGTFEMGATEDQQGSTILDDEYPVRTIKVNSYHIGKYEVTQAQWYAVMGTTLDDQISLSMYNKDTVGKGPDYPMYYVNWEDAQAFCKKLSKKTGKKYVLPTEAQWEYAARGGVHKTKTMYAGSDDIEEVAWYRKNSYDLGGAHPDYGTHKVGMKAANALGIYDMSGNVWEWCSDWYGNYDENGTDNPQGPVSGEGRVYRGGCWVTSAFFSRVSFRQYTRPDRRFYYGGFRVVCLP